MGIDFRKGEEMTFSATSNQRYSLVNEKEKRFSYFVVFVQKMGE